MVDNKNTKRKPVERMTLGPPAVVRYGPTIFNAIHTLARAWRYFSSESIKADVDARQGA